MIITNHRSKRRDGFALRGDLILHPIDWRRELTPYREALRRLLNSTMDTRQALAKAAPWRPPCIDLEHRAGACPLGLVHDVDEVKARNTVVDTFYAAVIDHLRGVTATALQTTYVAAGTSGDATTAGMTTLVSEYYRDVWTDQQEQTSTSLINYFFFSTSVANAYLHEFGAFSDDASATTDSGLLVGRWLYDFEKDSSKTLNGQYIIGKA